MVATAQRPGGHPITSGSLLLRVNLVERAKV
jgi:hypothetical protein